MPSSKLSLGASYLLGAHMTGASLVCASSEEINGDRETGDGENTESWDVSFQTQSSGRTPEQWRT